MPSPVAILTADLHFSEKPPVARSAEPDWFAAQERQWKQLRDAAQQKKVPIVIAGDVFDVWRSSPATINFALRMMQGFQWGIFAVPGQHDLPNHSYTEIERSAYWTLVRAEVMVNLKPDRVHEDYNGQLLMQGVPWGFEIPPGEMSGECPPVLLAVVHRYCWMMGKSYPDAPKENHAASISRQLAGYDAAVFGDNHKGFLAECNECTVLNCGGFMGRTSDERDYAPRYGVLYDVGTIRRVAFDISEDKWLDQEDVAEVAAERLDVSDLVDELQSLGGDALNFVELLTRYLDDRQVDLDVRKLVLQALEKGRENAET